MDRLSALHSKLAARERILATTIVGPEWPAMVEKIGGSPLDALVIDTEHGALSNETAEPLLRTARLVGLPTIVRVPDALPNFISKAIDMGADGIMLPRVESEAQLELAITALRFAPRGRKGCGGFSLFRSGEDFAQVNDNRMLWIQIESYEGMAALDGMLERFGDEVSCVIIGPYDLSIMTGVPLDIKGELMQKNVRKIFQISAAHGKSCGIFVDSPEDLTLWDGLGANVFWTGTELTLMMDGIMRLHREFLTLGGGA